MVTAPVAAGREAELRTLLASMNATPGGADPANRVLPFGAFEQLHFARLALLDDTTAVDLKVYDIAVPRFGTYLCLMGECDGDAAVLLAALAAQADAGLRLLFSHCEGFDARADLLAWLKARNAAPAANYVNRLGRTVRQVREESALREALAARVVRGALAGAGEAQQRRRELLDFVGAEVRAGRLTLTAPASTPLGWQLANLAHLIGVPLLGLIALPFLIVTLPIWIVMLRVRESRDPEVCPRPAASAVQAMQLLEDHDATNQFTALGAVKPGLFRRWLLTVLLALTDYACRHVFNRGFLARVQTIHFARWVFIDDKQRVAFASNYDGSHEAYMDDFINKVGWGLNILFSNGVGWPRTDWLILGGSRRELLFKHYQRRHQLPSQVWYKAYPGLTLTDLERGRRIREGLERTQMSDAEALAWLKLL
jgi:hypothetical protein